jgi:hypothetical protein
VLGDTEVLGELVGKCDALGEGLGDTEVLGELVGKCDALGEGLGDTEVLGELVGKCDALGEGVSGSELGDGAAVTGELMLDDGCNVMLGDAWNVALLPAEAEREGLNVPVSTVDIDGEGTTELNPVLVDDGIGVKVSAAPELGEGLPMLEGDTA